MAEDWFANVAKYAADADDKVVDKVVKYLGIALRNRDSSLVSFSDPTELGRVKERFLRKKLELTDADDVLDEALDWVKGVLSGDRTKNRVTVYYLLAHYFGKLGLFGGPSGTSAATLLGAAGGLGAAASGGESAAMATRSSAEPPAIPDPVPDREPIRAVSETPPASVTRAEPTPVPPQPAAADTASATYGARHETSAAHIASNDPGSTGSTTHQRSRSYGAKGDYDNDDDDGGTGWPKWLTWLLIAVAIVALFFLLRSCMTERQAVAPGSGTELTGATEDGFDSAGNLAANEATAGAVAEVPVGAGVVSGIRNSRPMLTVYFESGQSGVSNDMAAAAAPLKSYLDANPGSRLAVSGYNDPSGNAALNAELSKQRAQAVAATLASAGIPQGSIELVKPEATTSATVTPEQARRVEVTIQQ